MRGQSKLFSMARPRTALVLGGGGFVGGAWMAGALHAIARASGWDPGTADYVLGTSAGSVIGALLTSAIPPWLMMEYGNLEGVSQLGATPEARFGASFRMHWSFPVPVLGSPSLAMRSLREPWKYGPAGIIAWLPQGVVSTEPLKGVVRRVVPSGWVEHPHLWIVAIDYSTGERVVFGREGAPHADLAGAVAASCAIPGFYQPVRIGGRRYVDGGICSASNADLVHGQGLDLVIVLNPMSSLAKAPSHGAADLLAARMRQATGRRLGHELRKLRAEGTQVLVLQPTAEDLTVMGPNLMARGRRHEVIEQAVSSTAQQLRAGRGALPKPPRSRRAATTAARRAAA
jgi:NTE family protein